MLESTKKKRRKDKRKYERVIEKERREHEKRVGHLRGGLGDYEDRLV